MRPYRVPHLDVWLDLDAVQGVDAPVFIPGSPGTAVIRVHLAFQDKPRVLVLFAQTNEEYVFEDERDEVFFYSADRKQRLPFASVCSNIFAPLLREWSKGKACL